MSRSHEEDKRSILTDVMYGAVNAVMCIPVMISFTSIIFRDPAFASSLPKLVKLVLFSSMVHQIAFTLCSSLDFAVGQVQDAGLIFLSSMADSVVQIVGPDSPNTISTTLAVLATATASLGIMLILMGRLKMASFVQFLPMPVVGGYLAFIGFFCGEAGLAMMANEEVTKLSEWGKFCSIKAVILIAPGLMGGITVSLLMRCVSSPYVLPCFMGAFLSVFFIILAVTNTSLNDARAYGWVAPLVPEAPFYESWATYPTELSEIDWSAFPPQMLKVVGLFLIVAFSSSLDVAAIEMECGRPLNYDHELQTVGVANLASGLTGGFSGSYIFSQTIFSFRRGVTSRVNGWAVILSELVIIILPISITSYIPKAFFGSLLVLIACELMFEWLVLARAKMTDLEYGVCISTFGLILTLGVQSGMAAGIGVATAVFVVNYARMAGVTVASLRGSTAVRTFEEQKLLAKHRAKIVTVELSGYIFFGSAVSILSSIKEKIGARSGFVPIPRETQPSQSASAAEHGELRDILSSRAPSASRASQGGVMGWLSDIYLWVAGKLAITNPRRRIGEASPLLRRRMTKLSVHDRSSSFGTSLSLSAQDRHTVQERASRAATQDPCVPGRGLVDGGEEQPQVVPVVLTDPHSDMIPVNAPLAKMEFMVIDFTNVQGVDATAARCCFLMLNQLMRQHKVVVVWSSMSVEVERILRAQQVIDADDVVLPYCDDALEYCEEQVLSRYSIRLNMAHNSSYYDRAWRMRYQQAMESGEEDVSTAASFAIGGKPQEEIEKGKKNRHKGLFPNTATASAFPAADGGGAAAEGSSSRHSPQKRLKQIQVQLPALVVPEMSSLSPIRGTGRSPWAHRRRRSPFGPEEEGGGSCGGGSSRSSPSRIDDLEAPGERGIIDTHGWETTRVPSAGTGGEEEKKEEGKVQNQQERLEQELEGRGRETGIFLKRIMADFLGINRGLHRNPSVASMMEATFVPTPAQVSEKVLVHYFERKRITRSSPVIYKRGDLPEKVYLIEEGVIEIVLGDDNKEGYITRVNKFTSGGVFGCEAFLLNVSYSSSAVSVCAAGCVLWSLSRADLHRMETEDPSLCVLVQRMLLRSMALLGNAAQLNMHQTLDA